MNIYWYINMQNKELNGSVSFSLFLNDSKMAQTHFLFETLEHTKSAYFITFGLRAMVHSLGCFRFIT